MGYIQEGTDFVVLKVTITNVSAGDVRESITLSSARACLKNGWHKAFLRHALNVSSCIVTHLFAFIHLILQ